MSANKLRIDPRSKARLLKFAESAGHGRLQAEQLLNEIDNLALLLHEVRKQTDKIEAAADAIGDSILTRLSSDAVAQVESRTRSVPTMPAKGSRLKTLSPRALLMDNARP
jgi:hypothetical protein